LNITTTIVLASGGALGAISRYIIIDFTPKDLPYGTLLVNLIGSLIIGIVFAFVHNSNFSPYLRLFIATGFLGALTTYSTFALESFLLLYDKEFIYGLLNIILNVIGTIILAGVGYILTTYIIKSI